MSTTVRISRETSRGLDRLAARILLKGGRKVSKQDLLALILKTGLDEEKLLAQVAALNFPLPDGEWKRILREVPLDWRVETREEEIDEILYGESA